ncbi:hypothetical protein K2173_024934 [Erythroxylum novogranatense]|uniref:Uncharacterized protein n=1 Tax=Erythroxylum novogranatense TaxID=1862640 RepID=A0AAV8UE14_9ROSI|nr:hypothetical protein K2173_024934 [Erythroxylum novogranatense]
MLPVSREETTTEAMAVDQPDLGRCVNPGNHTVRGDHDLGLNDKIVAGYGKGKEIVESSGEREMIAALKGDEDGVILLELKRRRILDPSTAEAMGIREALSWVKEQSLNNFL